MYPFTFFGLNVYGKILLKGFCYLQFLLLSYMRYECIWFSCCCCFLLYSLFFFFFSSFIYGFNNFKHFNIHYFEIHLCISWYAERKRQARDWTKQKMTNNSLWINGIEMENGLLPENIYFCANGHVPHPNKPKQKHLMKLNEYYWNWYFCVCCVDADFV